jgi:hypothetical protein
MWWKALVKVGLVLVWLSEDLHIVDQDGGLSSWPWSLADGNGLGQKLVLAMWGDAYHRLYRTRWTVWGRTLLHDKGNVFGKVGVVGHDIG